ncbi:hypothetical protein HRI_003511600 [Hibiscus trionum]|uniref:Uncharacterized protein n=1 Tax=Hibiscus trionum TaxID=183268 RepID=A0A9W7IQT5_HIBTR|nr:hypothetical protein HRI_003511600 [Hibiscus trionum]
MQNQHLFQEGYPGPSLRRALNNSMISGINLQEEMEQLFSGHKPNIRVSEASRRVVHDDEKRYSFAEKVG